MAYSTDADLLKLIPDILELGIENFVLEHPKAELDVNRELRIRWWPKMGIAGDMVNENLSPSQFTALSSYLVLWRYALPQLTNWVDNDRFAKMIVFYKDRYKEELESVLNDGVDYDSDGDGIVLSAEKTAFTKRLDR